MRRTFHPVAVFTGLAGLVGVAGLVAVALGVTLVPETASAGNPVAVVVLKEHGVGTAAAAQPYLDQFIGIAATQNGWDPASKGKYTTTRPEAETWMKAEQPHYGIFSLAAFLAMKKTYNLEPIGSATLSTGGGQQYVIISQSAADLAGCKGKKLASDHLDDPRFIDKVVAGGSFTLADFTLNPTKRPIQTINEVLNASSDCALIDDAQVAQLAKMPGAGSVKQVWKSRTLEPMAVVAFPSAPAAEKAAFQQSLPKICQGNGQQVCTSVGLQTLTTASAQTYATSVAAYGP